MTMTAERTLKTILIVDDEKTAHQLYKIMLREKGYTFLHAENGREAVEVFLRNPQIDLILMDIKMPVMSGYDATKEIRKHNNNVVILAQTAYTMSYDKKKAFASGCNDHLAKPVEAKVLLEALAKYFNSA